MKLIERSGNVFVEMTKEEFEIIVPHYIKTCTAYETQYNLILQKHKNELQTLSYNVSNSRPK